MTHQRIAKQILTMCGQEKFPWLPIVQLKILSAILNSPISNWASNVITIIETMVISKIPIIVPFHDLNFLALSGSDITKSKNKIFEYANQILQKFLPGKRVGTFIIMKYYPMSYLGNLPIALLSPRIANMSTDNRTRIQ